MWRASCQGDRSAFGEVIERYQNSVCAVTYALTGDRALSEDLAQDAFLTAWERLRELREPDRLGSWLCGIARNLGRRARSTRRLVPLPEDATDSVPLPDDMLAALRQEELVWSTLAELAPTYREPLVLYYREGRSARRVGELLGLTPGAVEQRLSRGRKQLRREVQATVEATLQGTRPGPAFRRRVAAVLPLTAGLRTTASAAPGWLAPLLVGMTMKSMKTVFVVAVTAMALLLWLLSAASTAHDNPRVLVSDESEELPQPFATSSRPTETTPTQLDVTNSRIDDGDAPPQALPLQLTRHGSRATVNLDGGPSTMASFSTRGAPFTYDTADPQDDDGLNALMIPPPVPDAASKRGATGVVTDAEGAALPGALVLAGPGVTSERAPGREAYAAADEGTVADETGRFSVEMDASKPFNAVAVHEQGWSQLVSVPAGTETVALHLEISGRTQLRGAVRRAGEGVAAVISARPVDHDGVDFSTHASVDGRYELSLPPGTYRVDAAPSDAVESKAVSQTVTMVAADETTADFDLPVGTLVAVNVGLDDDLAVSHDGDGPSVLAWTLVPGHHALPTPEDSARVRQSLDPEDYFYFSSFSLDVEELLEEVRQFQDIEPGLWTACAELRQQTDQTLSGVGFSCTQFSIAPGQELAEVGLTLLPL